MSSHNRAEMAIIPALWQDDDRKRIRATIQQAFTEDPEISNATNISVVFAGEDRKELQIVGSVEDLKSYDRAEEIANNYTAEDVTVVNQLVVD